jgi:hypothetical protein
MTFGAAAASDARATGFVLSNIVPPPGSQWRSIASNDRMSVYTVA